MRWSRFYLFADLAAILFWRLRETGVLEGLFYLGGSAPVAVRSFQS